MAWSIASGRRGSSGLHIPERRLPEAYRGPSTSASSAMPSGTFRSQHPDAPKRLGQIVAEVGAIPVVGEPAVEQVGFEAEFDGDGRVVSRSDADAVIIGPGHRMEGARVMGERPRKVEVRIAPSGPHDTALAEPSAASPRRGITRLWVSWWSGMRDLPRSRPVAQIMLNGGVSEYFG